MHSLSVRERRIADLKVNPRNPRTHSKKQIRQIANSIREFGFTNPILLGDDDEIVAGHGRVAAAKLLGLETVLTPSLVLVKSPISRALVKTWPRSSVAVNLRYVVKVLANRSRSNPGDDDGRHAFAPRAWGSPKP